MSCCTYNLLLVYIQIYEYLYQCIHTIIWVEIIMNPNQLTIVKEYDFDKPPIQKIDSLIDKSIRDCHHKYFHKFDHVCEYDLNFTNIAKNETDNFTISDKCTGMHELNKKLAVARERDFKFNEINKLTIKIKSNLQSINKCYYLKHRIPMCHTLFLEEYHKLKNI